MNEKASSMTDKISKEEALYHLLKKERAYYESLLKIFQQENALLKIPAILPGSHGIHPLLEQKQALLKCIHEIEETLKPLKTSWNHEKNRNGSFSLKIHEEIRNLHFLLEEILQLDTDNQLHMEKHLLALKTLS
jgi:flagellar biosynthesis/type III secretory pathway chaperone